MPQFAVNGESVGIEIEVDDISPMSFVREINGDKFTVTHDASCEKDAVRLSSGLIVGRGVNIFRYTNVVLGGEIVSSILNTEDDSYINAIKSITGLLLENGEGLHSCRSSLHVHVCFTNPNLRMLKSSLRLWRHLEDLFFLVGGMGYQFRGEKNDCTYCRPLTGPGPILVPARYGVVQSLNIDDLLETKTTLQFWNRLGDLPNQAGERYVPVRYHAFNLVPAFSRGTMEFRIFNKTLNPLYIVSAIELCKSFTQFCLTASIDDFSEELNIENSIYEGRSKDEISQTFLKYAEKVKLSSETVDAIMHIVELTPPINLNRDQIISHLRNVNIHWRDSDYQPEPQDKYKKPHFEDLHVLRGER